MKTLSLFFILLFISALSFSQNSNDVVIAKKIKITSKVLNEDETIFVSLPKKYATSGKSYPVIYILDGSETMISYANGLTKSLSDYEIIPELIIVAIASNDRDRDYTPIKPTYFPDFVNVSRAGHADQFLSFIEKELFPYVEQNYRTVPFRIFAGHSFGGLCVTYAFVTRNDMFNSYIASSPSISWCFDLVNGKYNDKIASINVKNKSYFISATENEDSLFIKNVYSFARILELQAPPNLHWNCSFVKNEDHLTQVTNGLYCGLRYVYKGWKPDFGKMKNGGLAYIKDFYLNLSNLYGYEILPNENFINALGMEMTRDGKQDEAMKVFTYNTEIHPDCPESYSCLGKGYLQSGNNELAIKNLNKAVELAIRINDRNLERYKSQLEEAKVMKKE
ncbi:MAG TPA: alpha/beta hydrolase-fold protein [Bacteroidales bacterium]